LEENGGLIRLFPVPFRLVDDEKQFKKWQWIQVRVQKAKDDHRPESHKIFVDTIVCEGEPLPTKDGWKARRAALVGVEIFDDFQAVETNREKTGATLALMRPHRIVELDITPTKNPDWTEEERAKLVQDLQQEGLFDSRDAKKVAMLRKVPFDFHYRYECMLNGEAVSYRHKIADWEAGALYWNCKKNYGDDWEAAFRNKIERQLPAEDLMFLMGTIHRFPDQWLIVSLIYPKKQKPKRQTEQPHHPQLILL